MSTKGFFVALMLAAFPMIGVFADGVRFLTVNAKDGTKTEFALADEPKLSFANGELNIVSSSRTFSINLADVQNYAFTEESTGIAEVLKEDKVTLENGFVVLSCLSAGSKVVIYMQDGKMVKEHKTDDKGMAVVDLSVLPKGVLILQSNKRSIKIINR